MISIIPIIYLAVLPVFVLAYLTLLYVKRRRTGLWLHVRYGFRFYTCIAIFTVVFWGAIGLFTDIEREHVFRARYEAFFIDDNPNQKAYLFRYIDYPERSETVYSHELTRYLETSAPNEVRLTLITTWDFGDLRAYHLEKVDDIPVNTGWSNGNPPWDVLRAR